MLKDEFSIGKRYGMLTVIGDTFYETKDRKRNGKIYNMKVWFARFSCECGMETIANIKLVKHNKVRSCGCLLDKARKQAKYRLYKHDIKHPIYNIWKYMKNKSKSDKIKICKEWKNYDNFYEWAIKSWSEGYAIHNTGEQYCERTCSLIPRKEKIGLSNIKNFGLTKHPIYNAWSKLRIVYPDNICKEWKGFINFYNWSINYWQPNLMILRKNINLDYSEENCFWGNHSDKHDVYKEQILKNNIKKYGKSHPSKIIIDGNDLDFHAGELGITRSALNKRTSKYGIEQALSMSRQESGLEVFFANILDKYNIQYTRQFKISCRNQTRYADFLIDNSILLECDGLYWHSDAKLKNNYHRLKKEFYNSQNYNCLFFREDEILNKTEICMSILKNRLGLSSKIYARKCELVEIDKREAKQFFLENHLMGAGQGKCLALLYNKEIVSAMRYINKKDFVEISRFCTKMNTSVVGGFTKLLKYLPQKEIRTFVDQRYGDGSYLEKFGFKLERNNLSFRWVDNNSNSYHRMKFPGNTGYEQGCYKIWDCGQALYIKQNQ